MEKKYYRYLIYALLFSMLGISAAYILGIIPFTFSPFAKTPERSVSTGVGDSLKVIKLNKEAFNLRLTDPRNTIEIANRALVLARETNYAPGIAEAHRVIGIGFFYQDKIQLAVKNYIEALKQYKNLNDFRNQAKVYNNIGNLYRVIHDSENALKYFTKSLDIVQNLDDEELVSRLYFNIGSTLEQKKEYGKAIIYFDKSYQIFKRRNDQVYIAMYLQNSGLVHYKLRNFKIAESLLTKAIVKAKKINLYKVITGCDLILSSIYIQRGAYSDAEKILREGTHYSILLKDRTAEYAFLYKQYELKNAIRNYPEALKLLSTLFKRDSLLLKKNLSHNIGITLQHYIQQQKIQEKELIITKQKYREATFRWITTLGVSIFLLSAAVLLILYFLREKRRRRGEIIIQNNITSLEQKALQAMMNPHFVFNVMTSIQYFINQADSRTVNQILSGFASLVRKHLEICMNSTISVHEELVYLRLYLSLEKIRFSDKMDYEITIDNNIDTEEILIPSMLIQPFIENAIWHGIMPKDEGGVIKLNFDLDETDLLISIIDNGVGILNSESLRNTGHISRGMTLIRERVSLLNRLNERHIVIDQQQMGDHGTEVLIRIPA